MPKPEPLELKKAEAKTWGVKIQTPRSDPTPLLLYLARYTYRVAIDDKRIREIDTVAKTVTFTYRNFHLLLAALPKNKPRNPANIKAFSEAIPHLSKGVTP